MEPTNPENTSLPRNTPLDKIKWFNLVKAWDPKREKQKQYCERLGISLTTFSYVRSKLMKETKIKTKFISLTVNQADSPKTTEPELLTLENPQGFKLHFSPSLSLDQLTKLFKLSGWQNA